MISAISTEIIHELLLASASEAFEIGARTSRNPIIYDVLDYGYGICDRDGRLLAQARGIPVFLGCLADATAAVISKFGNDLAPGDVIVHNDPFGGPGTHLNDVVMTQPVFTDGQLVAFSIVKGHWAEIGGKDVGSWTIDSTDIFQEGLRIPCVKLIERGHLNEPLRDILMANSRLPDLTLGDLQSQLAAVRAGSTRIATIAERYGVEEFTQAVHRIYDHAERLTRKSLGSIPDGRYESTGVVDGLGMEPVPIRCAVDIVGDSMVVDFTGSGGAVNRPWNCSRTTLWTAARIVFQGVVGPTVPMNAGAWRALDVRCPDGTIFTAEAPAPVSVYFDVAALAADLVWRALAPVIPERLPAGHFAAPCATKIVGRNRVTGEEFIIGDLQLGGWGASKTRDGTDALCALVDGETYANSCEVLESRYGIVVDRFGLDSDSGGDGEFRGGLGAVREYRVTDPGGALATVTMVRWHDGAWGLQGGKNGAPNRVEIVRVDGTVERHGPIANLRVYEGEVIRCIAGGGGGWGNPAARAPERRAQDFAQGKVSIAGRSSIPVVAQFELS